MLKETKLPLSSYKRTKKYDGKGKSMAKSIIEISAKSTIKMETIYDDNVEIRSNSAENRYRVNSAMRYSFNSADAAFLS